MPSQACLNNIKKEDPPVYCNDIVPGMCDRIQDKINKYCKHNGLGGDVPVPQTTDKGDCWCCCSCFAFGTPIEVQPDLYKLIQTIEIGETVMTTGPDLQGWQPRVVTERGGIAPEVEVDFMLTGMFRLANGEQRILITTADHLFLNGMDGPTLISMQDLRPGDLVRQADGGAATVEFVTWSQFSGGVRHVAMGSWEPGDSLDGHLMNSNGLVTADLAVQLSHYGGNLPPDQVLRADPEERPEIGSAAFHAKYDTTAYTAFVNDPDAWPPNMRPLSPTLINIPPSALPYFSQAQADDIQAAIGMQFLGDSAALALANYLFTIYAAWFSDVYFIVDWANESPNAWYFMEYKRRYVVLTGGLMRVPFLGREGVSIVLSHLVAQASGIGCTGEADYEGIGTYLRSVWRNELFFQTYKTGYPKVFEMFDLIKPEHAGEDPNNVCRQPSIACRKEAILAGGSFDDLPACAIPAPEFRVVKAAAKGLNAVRLEFSAAFNQPSGSNPANYVFSPAAKALAVQFDRDDAKALTVTVDGLDAGRTYKLTVSNVFSLRGIPLAPGYDRAEFTTA